VAPRSLRRQEIDRIFSHLRSSHLRSGWHFVLYSENTIKTWAIRAGGWIGLIIAVSLFFKPLEVIAGSLPLVGWLAEDLVEVGTGMVAFLVGTASAAVVIALGWLFYRPLLGIALFVLAGLLIGGLTYLLVSVRRDRGAQGA